MHSRTEKTHRTKRGHVAWKDGVTAELLVEQALVARDWHILLRRARSPLGEIDLVALKEGRLTFIEVKKRVTHSLAAHAVSERQRQRIMNAAELLLATHAEWEYETIAFDVIIVDEGGAVRRIKDAFWQA
ncbi:MAG: YraN family protein [Acetobacter sp.]